MTLKFLSVIFLVLIQWKVKATSVYKLPEELHQHNSNLEYNVEEKSSQRDDKQLLFVQIAPEDCTTNDEEMLNGVCQTSTGCIEKGGKLSGTCAGGYGACCILPMGCSKTTATNNTYFMSPNYPDSDTGTSTCTMSVDRMNKNICQIRLDFIDLLLSQPDANGLCLKDFLTVNGGSYENPFICGDNKGQHIYVDVEPDGGPVSIVVDRSNAYKDIRKWNIRISQFECGSLYRAPPNCLQYFTQTTGTVNSFNFAEELDHDDTPPTTRQLACQKYGVCLKLRPGYCSVYWSRNTEIGNHSFTVSGSVTATKTDIIGSPPSSTVGSECNTDYVMIPGGIDGDGNNHDRYCGLGFPSFVSSDMQPAVLYVNSDCNEDSDTFNRGFSLNYRQVKC